MTDTTFSIPAIDFRGQPAVQLPGPKGSQLVVSLLGGQVLSWITPDGRERLYLSDQAVFDGVTPIRGGIPVCFPQFANQGDLPKHGFLRTRVWEVTTVRASKDFALLSMAFLSDESTLSLWPYEFRAEITFMLEEDRLDIEFSIENTGGQTMAFTGALHTYLKVVQVEDVSIEGLYGHDYRDSLTGEVKRETGTELIIEKETDRIYRDVSRPLMLKAGNHSLGIQVRDFADVVVWNPWVDRCAALEDMPTEGWRHMLCIEAAAASEPVVVDAGEEWCGRQAFVVL